MNDQELEIAQRLADYFKGFKRDQKIERQKKKEEERKINPRPKHKWDCS